MVATSFFVLAASSIIPLALGAPISRRQGNGNNYQLFGGDGSLNQGWPSDNQWLSFDELWAINKPILEVSCKQFGAQDNTAEEIDAIKGALSTVSSESKMDSRYLLAVMMQESKGCVRAPTTNYGQNNPGLMQSFNGLATCNPDNVNFKTPCPKETIVEMIREGAGIGRPFGLMQAMEQSAATDASKYYKASRIYNSGSIAASGNLGDGIATHCYASDIAARLVGWKSDEQHTSTCNEGSIGGVQGGSGAYAGPVNNGGNGQTNPPTTAPTKSTPANPPANAPAAPSTTPVAAPTTNEPTAPKVPGAAGNCKSWYTIQAGDDCSKVPASSFDTLRQLNKDLNGNCSNLWLGYAYCTSA